MAEGWVQNLTIGGRTSEEDWFRKHVGLLCHFICRTSPSLCPLSLEEDFILVTKWRGWLRSF